MDRAAEDALNALPRAALAPEEQGRSRQRGRGRGRGRGGARSRSRSPLVQYLYSAPASESVISDLVLMVAAIASSCDIPDDALARVNAAQPGETLAAEAKALAERLQLLASPAMLALKAENAKLQKDVEDLQDQVLDKQIFEDQ